MLLLQLLPYEKLLLEKVKYPVEPEPRRPDVLEPLEPHVPQLPDRPKRVEALKAKQERPFVETVAHPPFLHQT